MTWPQVLWVVELVEQVYPQWELRAIEGTTDVDGVRRGTYDNGTYEMAADRYLITVACPTAAATTGGAEDTLPAGCYRDIQAHGRDGTYVCYALMTEDAAQRLILDGPSGGPRPDDTPARR